MTLKLPTLSYKRGFVRLYAVLAVAWIVALLFALPPYRLKFWESPIDYYALAEKARAIDDSYATRVKESKEGVPGVLAPLPEGYILEHTVAWTKQRQAEEEAVKRYGATVLPADFFNRKQDYASLGKTIKALYPKAYDDVDDAVLGVRVAAKNPNTLAPAGGDIFDRAAASDAISRLKPPIRIGDLADAPPRDSFVPNKPGFAESRAGKTLWLAGMLLGPPLAVYLGLFLIVPWIYRGFRPVAPI